MMQIYILRDGKSTGPFSEADVRKQFIAGTVTGATVVWWEGLAQWQPLGMTPWGAASGIGMPAPEISVTQSRRAPGAGRRKNIPLLAIAPVFMALAVPVVTIIGHKLELLFLPLTLGTVITGHLARRYMENHDPLDRRGSGVATIGLIVGYLWLALFLAEVLALPGLSSSDIRRRYLENHEISPDDPAAPATTPDPSPAAPASQ